MVRQDLSLFPRTMISEKSHFPLVELRWKSKGKPEPPRASFVAGALAGAGGWGPASGEVGDGWPAVSGGAGQVTVALAANGRPGPFSSVVRC